MQLYRLRMRVFREDEQSTYRYYFFSPRALVENGVTRHCFVHLRLGPDIDDYISSNLVDVKTAPSLWSTTVWLSMDDNWVDIHATEVPPPCWNEGFEYQRNRDARLDEITWSEISVGEGFLEEFIAKAQEPRLTPPRAASRVLVVVAGALLALYIIASLWMKR